MKTRKLPLVAAVVVLNVLTWISAPSAAVAGLTSVYNVAIPGEGGTAGGEEAGGQAPSQGLAEPMTVRPTPPGYPTGIDVSGYQPGMNWPSVGAAGIKFVYAKATEGTTYSNPLFVSQYEGAKQAGIYAGAYVFGRPDMPNPVAQADYFMSRARFASDGMTLPPMLDMESPYGGSGVTGTCWGVAPAAMVAWIRAFVNEVARFTARPMVIYANRPWWNQCTGNSTDFSDQYLDIACWCTTPVMPAGWTDWTFWQYANEGSQPGDQDVFNGSLAELAAFAAPSTPYELHYAYKRDSAMWQVWWNGGTWHTQPLGLAMDSNSGLAASTYLNELHFVARSGGMLWQVWWNGSIMQRQPLGYLMDPGSPLAAVDYVNGGVHELHYAFRSGGWLWQVWWNGSVWQLQPLGLAMDSNSGLAASTYLNELHFVVRSGGMLWQVWWNGSIMQRQPLGYTTDPGSPLAAVDYESSGLHELHYAYRSGGWLWQVWWNGSVWQLQPLGLAMDSNSGLAASTYLNELHFIARYAGTLWQVWWNGSIMQRQPLGYTTDAGTPLAAVAYTSQ